MHISIFGHRINVMVLVLIAVVYFVMASHTLGSCCNFGFMEGLETMAKTAADKTVAAVTPTAPQAAAGDLGKIKKSVAREGFVGANTNAGLSTPFDLLHDKPVNTAAWFQPNLDPKRGESSAGLQALMNRPAQTLPLPEGEMDMFANTQFKPECCPNTYTSSSGCACMTVGQYDYLIHRAGNNVPYSEY